MHFRGISLRARYTMRGIDLVYAAMPFLSICLRARTDLLYAATSRLPLRLPRPSTSSRVLAPYRPIHSLPDVRC